MNSKGPVEIKLLLWSLAKWKLWDQEMKEQLLKKKKKQTKNQKKPNSLVDLLLSKTMNQIL